jgi:CheY-like chemotaxis protein
MQREGKKMESAKKILLADDEQLVVNVAKAMLTHLGYDVIIAQDGQEALDLFNQHKDSLSMVILDCNMPMLNGFDCLNSIRKISNIPAIIATGSSSAMTENEMMQLKAQGILPKPFSLGDMKTIIDRILT